MADIAALAPKRGKIQFLRIKVHVDALIVALIFAQTIKTTHRNKLPIARNGAAITSPTELIVPLSGPS
ncbi:MAG TPA: hypothetical protein VF452_19885, partial [Candidatus Binatia bacterium]